MTDPSDRADADAETDTSAADAADGSTAPNRRHRVAAVAGVLGIGLVALAVVLSRPAPPPAPAAEAAPPVAAPPATGTTAPPTTAEPTTTTAAPEPGVTTTTRKPRITPSGPPGPLTGTPVDQPGYERRPALILKIDNLDPYARPQAGLTLADIVYEEKVEGPYSRFAAIFHGADADPIGPIRSARSTDVQIAGPLQTPLFGYSGSNFNFQRLLSIAPLIDVGAGARGGSYYRGGDKPIPHNLYTSTGLIYNGSRGYVPTPLWSFRGPDESPGAGARAARSATYHFGGGVTTVSWTWDAEQKAWMRVQNGTTHFDTDNWPVAAQNVILQYVPYQASIAQDMYGNPIPEALLGGTGRGWVLSGGAAVPMTWSRYAIEQPTRYAGADGQELRFAPGRTWVILLPLEFPALVRFADGSAGS